MAPEGDSLLCVLGVRNRSFCLRCRLPVVLAGLALAPAPGVDEETVVEGAGISAPPKEVTALGFRKEIRLLPADPDPGRHVDDDRL